MKIQEGLHERRALKISIAATFLLAVVGILFGLLSGSLAIVFDGMFNMVDTVISILAFFVARLLTSKGNRRFQYGYWHIEPMVLVLNGCILILLCTYALVNAIGSLMSGGHELNFDWAFVFALLVFFLSTGMYFYLIKKNRKIKSEFLRLDIQSWLMSALISTSLLLAFGIATFLHDGTYGYFTPYIDPLILAILTAFLIFVPIAAVRDAMRDIFRMAPLDLDKKIREFLDELIKQRDFKSYTSYVAKIGRAQFIEIHIVVPMGYPISSIEALDEIRNEITLAIGEDTPQRWLTIAFTANEQWI
ncbi:TPA: cation diffusion facilitator family transporter [Legionella pneumophila]|uniref:cation diffusion facilitator family transporter n=1 Tax=Legionella pneumophila TaxID=446 RepID=UPI000787FF80|nr:cation diffusion facilitator family transporter [Legionella pneumophila]MDW8877631.1 cation diffusion facilitator family transporter [Legionella pneumophila subsp. fraseri]MDW8960670.1 cation diffusion facilitator family transporter [Legionella pneumophila subsp. fraseri]MDW9035307.1 cation diffusion facilitator family transporter [Legionella pneumophila subsp. fraseri]MDW9038368.1 cation diffusion facilitator family transporter [Legionella pneumophila subsp. fraseri]MDW9041429.1 cation dif